MENYEKQVLTIRREKDVREMIAENYDTLPKMGLDDTFEFSCRACGRCCKNRTDIILTPYDVFRIAKHLGRTTGEVIQRYCNVVEGPSSNLPIPRLSPVPPNNSCPFLRNKKCSVHSSKPGPCRFYPLTRLFGLDGASQYLLHAGKCNDKTPAKYTVREWIGDLATEESEQVGRLWTDMAMCISESYRREKLDISMETREKAYHAIFWALYLTYDTQEPFLPQIQKNYLVLTASFEKLGIQMMNKEDILKEYK